MRYNVARGEMAKKTKKDGTISKVNDVKATYATGNIIETNFGIFTSVKAEQRIHIAKSGKQYKVWFVTLKDAQGNTFTIKHQQCKNKNMPKGTVINRPVIAGLLPAPKPVINKIIEEVEQITNKHFNSHNNPSEYYHSFKSAVAFIKRNRRFYRDKLPGYYRELSNCYHPDRCNTHLYQQPYTAEDYMSVIQTLR